MRLYGIGRVLIVFNNASLASHPVHGHSHLIFRLCNQNHKKCNNPTPIHVAYTLAQRYSTNNVEGQNVLELPKMGHTFVYVIL